MKRQLQFSGLLAVILLTGSLVIGQLRHTDDDFLLYGVTETEPTALLAILFDMTRECTGADLAQFGELTWFIADSLFERQGDSLVALSGLYDPAIPGIYLAVDTPAVMTATVTHELVHHFLPYAAHHGRIMRQCGENSFM